MSDAETETQTQEAIPKLKLFLIECEYSSKSLESSSVSLIESEIEERPLAPKR
jgi:hypothetical protein